MTATLTKAGFWRKTADSSALREPRVLIRVYVGEGEIDRAIAFYQQLHGVTADMRFDFPEHRLVLAAVGPFLILEGSEENLRPFRSTLGTLLVDDIYPYHQRLLAAGAEIFFGPVEVPTGACFNARLPDGTQIEYVHHRPRDGE
ncbi:MULTISPECIES: VOC family protein [Serratia]|uniref:Predicted enzyme related to lactoylglutathione lyase n=1 Tax=Serratia ficaria TaxID=61651 RepID=A0A240C9Y5_SERFI|nr:MULTISPECIES: glyoxalase/bleomycin resistance/dioxygenase family protein [Serratia]REF43275.1 putative enzyme related to lactoylglutathione lyase [Serratia ficaria]CAI0702726.1 Predicted enzyme related to lactoylglutathione lyase [Serratia ficaria]CAI1061061.1 Predicted enzyme related to lactoylglutathione lyase [Serratia ficaria]CAI1088032.1 Predicted enzyme related to lactoylglutathione lyase [Serratia ficaria]CAI1116176.1 Predicted enzyme related to lactoylglutathione lyase [Serratia fic